MLVDGCRVVDVIATSFFDLEVMYTIKSFDPLVPLMFNINSNTGSVSPNQVLKYAFNPHLYTMIVTATEVVKQDGPKMLNTTSIEVSIDLSITSLEIVPFPV